MLLLSMLDLVRAPRCVNGLFGVPKPDGQIRLFLDACPANGWFVDPLRVSLPSPSHLSQLIVSHGQPVWVANSDLSNFYHQLVMPVWMRPYFCLPALSDAEVASLRSVQDLPASAIDALRGGGAFFRAPLTLPLCPYSALGSSGAFFRAYAVVTCDLSRSCAQFGVSQSWSMCPLLIYRRRLGGFVEAGR